MNGKLRVAGIGLALSVLAGLVLLIVRPGLDPARLRPLPLLIGAWMAFIAAAWLLRKVPRRAAVALILLGGIADPGWPRCPRRRSNSTDLYRYIWDGRVQAAGIDPYQYVPTATQLTGLRNEFLFYPKAQYCVSPSYVSSHPAAELTAGCTRINRPTVPTIYPPVAEAYFLGVHYLHPADDSSTPDPGGHRAGGRADDRAAAVRPGPAGPGRSDGRAVVVVPDGGPGGGQQRPRRRDRGGHHRGRDARAGHGAHHAAGPYSAGPARPGHRDQADPRAGRARGAAPPLGDGRGLGGQRVRRGLPAARARGGRQGDRVPARLPAAGELHQRDQVRDHRPVRHRAAGQRGGRAHPGRDRPRRAGVLRPRPALAGRPRT